MHGWEPSERHEHYDSDGTLTGYTVVVREPEWDDYERDRLLALAIYEAGFCDCGLHRSVIADPENNHFMLEDEVCPTCATLAVQGRVQAEADEKALKELGKTPPAKARRPSDGRRTYLKPVTPSDGAGRRQR